MTKKEEKLVNGFVKTLGKKGMFIPEELIANSGKKPSGYIKIVPMGTIMKEYSKLVKQIEGKR